jgi:hypothetical protein
MRNIAAALGIAWVAAAVIAMFYWGWLESQGAPGIIFKSGIGDVYVFAVAAIPGYFLYRWGNKGSDDA